MLNNEKTMLNNKHETRLTLLKLKWRANAVNNNET